MANALRKPEVLSFKENYAENWRVFEWEYDIYVEAAHPTAETKIRAYILLNLAGKDAIETARSFTYAQGESKEDSACLKAKFKALCEPKKNINMLRHRFNTPKQKASETFQSYLVDLRNKADACKLGDTIEEFIRDRIVGGISSDAVRKLLLQEVDLTFDKAVQICQLHELAESVNKAVNQDPDVNVIKQKKIFKKQTPQYR